MARRPPDAELIVFHCLPLDETSTAPRLRARCSPRAYRLSEEFDRSMEDAAWLPEVTKRGWAVATRDNRIRHRPAERAAIREAGTVLIVLRGDGLRGEVMAHMLVGAYPTLKRLAARYQPPMIIHIYADGRLTMTENGGRRGPRR